MTTYINPKAKLFAHMDVLHAVQQGKRPAPVNVEIFLSNRCSHACSWCAYGHTHTKGPLAGKVARPPGAIGSGDVMDYALAKRILKELAAAGVKSITWSGGGEPTLHRQFDEIAEYAHGQGLEQGIYTHGGHLDEERAALVKELFTWAFVSLDECTRATFQASKGVDRFDAVLAGIRQLVAAPGKATVGVGFLLHAHNYNHVGEMVALGRELGVDYVQFRPTVRYDQTAPDRLDEDTAWLNWAIGHLRAFDDDPFVLADIARFKLYQHWQGHGYDTCYWSALQTAISPSGQVWRCTNKTEHADALLGDLSAESFAAVWARSGGPCAVDGTCRVLCRGHLSNVMLSEIMADGGAHKNFI